MKHRLHKLQINKVALVDAGAGKGVRVQLFKRRDGAGGNVTKTTKTEVKKMTREEFAALTPEEQDALLAALSKSEPEMTEEEKAKRAAAEEAEKAVAKARAEKDAEIVKLQKRLDEVEKREARAALVSRVEKSMRGLEGAPEEIADELLAVSDEAAREKLAKRFEVASASRVELLKKSGMLKPIGSTRTGEPIAPAAEFDELVAKAMKDEGIKKKADAISVIAKRRPELYEAVKAAHTQKEAV